MEIAKLSVFTCYEIPFLPVESRFPKHEYLKIDDHSRYNDHYECYWHFPRIALNIQNGEFDQIVLFISFWKRLDIGRI